MVTNSEKISLLESRIIAISRIKWNKLSDLEKKLEKSFDKFNDKQIKKFIAAVMKDDAILAELNEFVDRNTYPDQK